jgi:hypothetical protein
MRKFCRFFSAINAILSASDESAPGPSGTFLVRRYDEAGRVPFGLALSTALGSNWAKTCES